LIPHEKEIVMSRLLWAGLLALPLFVLPSRSEAAGFGSNYCMGFGLPALRVDWSLRWKLCDPCGCNPALYAAPWYLYYPYDAHFQVQAPLGHYPYWPPAMSPEGPFQTAWGAGCCPGGCPGGQAPMPYQPVGYYPQPGYGYGH
jgi:hypothetical protein